MADIFDVFQFNRENIINWLKDMVLFFRAPRRYVNELATKPGKELLPQFLFYFLAYSASFLFISTVSASEIWKPAILNLTSSIWAILILCFSSWIVVGKSYFKEILILLLSVSFFTNAFGLMLFSQFINSEDYTYKLIFSIWNCLVMIFWVFGFGFIIQKSTKKAFILIAVNYIVMNLLVLGVQRINFDKYGSVTLIESVDPIYDEYADLVLPLKQKDKIPVQRFHTVILGKVNTDFVLQDIINENTGQGNTVENAMYKEEIVQYCAYLEKQIEKLKFNRNKKIAKDWYRFYGAILTQINYQVKDTTELYKLDGLKLLSTDSLGRFKMYLSPINFMDSIFALQYSIKDYHNNIIQSSITAETPNDATYVAQSFLSIVLDNFIAYLLDEDKGKPYNEKFKKLKD